MVSSDAGGEARPAGSRSRFPGAVATLAIVTVLVWIAALFIPAGVYQVDEDGSPIPGTYSLFLPLMRALGYDRLVTAAMIILGDLVGLMAATVNPFSIGVAANESGVSIGDGIGLLLLLWVVLTAMAVAWVLRYAARARRDPTASRVAADADDGVAGGGDHHAAAGGPAQASLTVLQKRVLAITAAAFGLMIFSVIPWSAVVGGRAAPADDYGTYEVVGVEPFWFELNWWFPELSMLFVLAAALVGFVARMGEKEMVRLISAGAADMIGPAMVVLLAGGVSAIMNNTQTMAAILYSMEQVVSGASAGVFTLLAVLVGGLAIAGVGYDRYLRFAWPLLLALFAVSTAIVAAVAGLG